MSKIISVNAGSSSLKFQLFEMDDETVITSGVIERIGLEDSIFTIKYNGEKDVTTLPIENHKVAVQLLLDTLIKKEIVKDLDEIKGVGHRVVQGGAYFDQSVIIDEDVVSKIDELKSLAPLHNPAHLTGYYAFKEAIPNAGAVAVFDTAFHQTMPEKAYMYGLPYEYYEKYKVRRYGFHGTSHSFVSKRAAEVMGKSYDEVKTIVCHLGNGSSVSAVLNGKCVDTSMGLTPLEGLVMGTRSGDIDPAIMEFIAKKENLDIEGVMEVLNKKSGVFGLSGGLSSDFRDLTDAMNAGDKKAKIAMDVFSYRVAKYIGSYAAAMNGVDDIVFTAGIGENDDYVREEVCKYLGYLGVDFDSEVNKGLRGKEAELTKEGSKVKVFVIPTNEELAIARETLALVK